MKSRGRRQRLRGRPLAPPANSRGDCTHGRPAMSPSRAPLRRRSHVLLLLLPLLPPLATVLCSSATVAVSRTRNRMLSTDGSACAYSITKCRPYLREQRPGISKRQRLKHARFVMLCSGSAHVGGREAGHCACSFRLRAKFDESKSTMTAVELTGEPECLELPQRGKELLHFTVIHLER